MQRIEEQVAAFEQAVQSLRAELAASRVRERRYRNLFDTMLEGFGTAEILLDERGRPYDYRLLEVNPAFGRLTGFAPEVAIGKTARELVPDIEPHWVETYGKVALTGEPARFEAYSERLGRWFEVFAYGAGPRRFAHLFVDITERKRSEGALRQSEERLRLITDNLPVLIAYVDSEERYQFNNLTFQRWFGVPPGELAGRRVPDILGAAAYAVIGPYLRRALAGEAVRYSQTVPFTTGTRDVEAVYIPDTASAGAEVHGCYVLAQDVSELSEHKRVEEELRRREQEFRTLAEHIPDNIARYDRSLRYRYVNPAMEASTGIPRESFIGKTDSELGISEELIAAWATLNQRVFDCGQEERSEFHYPTPQGERYFEARLVPEFGPDGRVETILAVTRDLTDRKQMEEALQTAAYELRERMKELRCLYAVASLTQQTALPLGKMMRGTLEVLPPAYRFPEVACARAMLHDQCYRTEPFLVTPWRQAAAIVLDGQAAGLLEVFYRQERPSADEGPFLKEERSMLDTVAELLGRNLKERRDQAEQVRVQAALRQNEAALKEAQRLAHLGSWEWDRVRAISRWSDEMFRIAGYEPQAFEVTPLRTLAVIHPQDRRLLARTVREAVAAGRGFFLEHRIMRPDGDVRVVENRADPVLDSAEQVEGLRGTWLDVTGRKQAEEQLKRTVRELEATNRRLDHLSRHDALTGLANRRYLFTYLDSEWRRERRHGHPISLIMVDIDYFKLFNDTYGHQSGDECLRQVAEGLGTRLRRPADLLARYGGEEFAVVLPETPAGGARRLAEAMRRGILDLQLPHRASPVAPFVTISLGLAQVYPDHHSIDELITRADEALYRAKAAGRNRVDAAEPVGP